jgi:hypothetical protein
LIFSACRRTTIRTGSSRWRLAFWSLGVWLSKRKKRKQKKAICIWSWRAFTGFSGFVFRLFFVFLWSLDQLEKVQSIAFCSSCDLLSPAVVKEKALLAQIALNTPTESTLLPPNDSGEIHGEFRKDLLLHLDACLTACPINISSRRGRLWRLQLSFAKFFQ